MSALNLLVVLDVGKKGSKSRSPTELSEITVLITIFIRFVRPSKQSVNTVATPYLGSGALSYIILYIYTESIICHKV
jgi:hypothetical protein